MWSSLSSALARNEAATRGYLTKTEQNRSGLACCEAELEQNELALESNRIALQGVRD